MNSKQNIASKVGKWSAGHRKTAILGWLLFVVLAVGLMGSGTLEKKTLASVDQISGQSGEAERILDEAGLRPTEEIVLIQNNNATVDDPAFEAVIEESAQSLAATKHVRNVESPLAGPGGGISDDGHTAFVEFELAGDEKEAEENLDPSTVAVDRVERENPEYTVGQFGGASANAAIEETLQGDLGKAGMLSLPITLLILFVALGALVAASVPFVLALTSVLATMAMVAIPSQAYALGGNVEALILLIGLAVGVDYSLFYMRRQREERAAGRDNREALEVAAATSGRAVMISGLTVIIAMAGMFITGDATFISFAIATVSVVVVAMFATLAVLPAVLAWLGDRVEKGRLPFSKRRRGVARESRFWSKVVTGVMRRPIASIAVAGGLLVALAVPALQMNVVQSGPDELSRDIPVMKTYDRYTTAFPAKGNAVTVVVKADDVRSGEVAAGIDSLVAQSDRADVVVGDSEVIYSKDGSVAKLTIPTQGEATDEQSMAALDEIRDEIVPATVGEVESATVKVSGGAAQSSDFADLLSERMPLVFAFVLGLAFLLMLVTFRSIVIPIKAIVLNLLSVGAAYGVLVLVFQKGLGEKLLGFESNGGITNWLPLFLFVILFGLSMDYHVFILTRVREAYDRGMSTEDAVRKGIAGSAGTVTSAAIVMVMVFSVFATLSFIDFKEMGVGLAVAILIDATIIRGVLLPATMKLLGDLNWYLPSWLEWLPQPGHESEQIDETPVQAEPARA
jgi:RND superfamily putative drug exporter